ncbi:MAG TPA: hypothetical protein DEP69_00730, partial [Acidimicrobiaceae bacterium]|nr:hypothetical protein [Acidimicrobiaceae bacterium]
GEAVGQILDRLGPSPDVAAVFVAGEHVGRFGEMAAVIDDLLAPGALVGSTACALVGGSREFEDCAAVTVWAGRTGGGFEARHISGHDVQEEAGALGALDPGDAHTLVLLADPYSFDVGAALALWTRHAPHLNVVGGLASAGRTRDRLVAGGTVHDNGAAALLVSGDTAVVPLVSQGCRPIGRPLVITESHRNQITGLGGKPPAVRIGEATDALDDDDRRLLRGGLLIGLVVDEHLAEFGRGDFLIRNIVGVERSTGAIAIADEAPVGATVQFHVRDASTAHDDLAELVAGVSAGAGADRDGAAADGALLFTCNGRGHHMFSEPDHDAAALAAVTADAAVAGMFCAGEVGPIGGRSAVHGFTASAALFRDPDSRPSRPSRDVPAD